MFARVCNFWIDDIFVCSPASYTILQACSLTGIEVPRFCYHEKLSIAGNCRMCLVEVSNSKKLVASCAVPVSENLRIYTNNLRVKKARESVLEFLLANHPLDCPICDQGGECDLQDITVSFGPDRGRFYETEKRAIEDKYCGPLIKTVMTRCIHCTRCIRFISEVAGFPDLGTTGRGSRMEVNSYVVDVLNSEISANIIDLCPVGALTSKPYSFTSRPWELQSVESIDIFDVVCSNTKLSILGNKVKRILPRINENLNEDWLTNKARYIYDSFEIQRVIIPCVSLKNLSFLLFCDLRFYSGLNCFDFWLSVSWKEALFLTLKFLNSKRISFLAGSFLDLETVWSLKSFFSNLGFFSNSSTLVDHCEGVYSTIRLRDIEKYSTFVSVANNLRLETPLINTRVRKSYNFFMSDFSFFSFGSATSYFTYSVKSISNNKFKFLSLILGKLSLSKFITGRKGNLVIFHSDVEFSIFTGLFELFIKPSFVKISRSVSILAARVFGLDFSTKGLFNYSVGCESIPSLIYQGHHGGSISYFSSLILPSSLYAEKTSSYVNFEGVIQLAHAAITPSKFVRKDWEIFAAIFELYKSVTDLYNSKIAANKLNNLLPSWNSITKHNLVISRESLMNNIFRNSLFKASILNYYWTDSFCFNSKIMANCAKILINKNSNFN